MNLSGLFPAPKNFDKKRNEFSMDQFGRKYFWENKRYNRQISFCNIHIQSSFVIPGTRTIITKSANLTVTHIVFALSICPFSHLTWCFFSRSFFQQSWLRWEYNSIASVPGLNRHSNPSSRLNEKVLSAILLLATPVIPRSPKLYFREKKKALNDEEWHSLNAASHCEAACF